MLIHLLLKLEKIFESYPNWAVIVSFLAGLIASLSPCIYPLIPITLGVIGVTTFNSKLKGFIVSFVFVLGIATTYTIIGIFVSFFGILINKFLLNSFVYIFLSIFFLFLGLSQLEIIKLKWLFFSYNYDRIFNKFFNMFSIFGLGMVSGLANSICIFPVLGAILVFISTKKNIIYGVSLLFSFSLGYGSLLIVLGTFVSLIRKLPKQGVWLIIIQKILGFILLGLGIYYFLKFIIR